MKILVDTVIYSKFITEKKSIKLVEKISTLTSSSLSNELNRNVYIERRIKQENEQFYLPMDIIQMAIRHKKKIEFKYLEDPNKKLTVKNSGYWYEFSLYTMLWVDDRYYCVGYSKH